MDKKSSMSRIERQKREKVLRFSIRKYSFGAASVAVAALMFLGARVVSADSVTPVDKPHVEALTQDTSPLASQDKEEPASSVKVDTATASQLVAQIKDQLHVKEAANTDLLVAAKEELVKAEQTLADSKVSQEEVDALVARLTNVLDQLRAVEVSQGKEDKNGESTQEATPEIKPEVAKPTSEISAKSEETSENTNAEQLEKAKASLKLSIERLEQTIAQTPENDLTREILEKAIAQVAVAKSAFGGVEVSLRDVEDMNRVIKRNESSVMIARNRLTSGSHDPRNGQSMGQGTQFRAYTATSSSGALKNVRYFASVDKRTNGGSNTRNDDPEFTEKKTVIKAKYEQNSSGKWMVYDVYFNNNGVSMADKSFSQHYYFQPPFNIMDGSNTVENLTFTRYKNVDGNPNRKLSDGGSGFQKVGETAVISYPWAQKTKIFPGDRRATYDPQGVSRADQKWQVFKNNQNDPYLDKIVRKTDGNYTGGVSYTLGLEVGKEDLDYAVHMTARVKLKDNVTEKEAAYGNVYAASNTTGRTTNQSYIVGSQGTSVKAEPDAPKDPIKGLTVTKTVGDNAGDPINPVSSGYVKHGKDGTFPAGMSWSWAGESPSTAKAGVFKYTSIATYQDGSKSTDANSGSDGTVTLIVKPKKPTITTSVENKKGLTGQQITVNVGSGVPNGSTVKLYDGDTVIGTGTTNGETATVTVTGALPGNPITAETVVDNGGTVTSDKSEPVTPTEAPDNQPPTLAITPDKPVRVVEGQTVTFTVTARDDKHVNLNADDFLAKYGTRVFSNQASFASTTDTDTEKVRTVTITTTAEDVGKTNTITFKATDNAGNKADDVTFTFEVTPADKIPPTITAESATVTKNEPITPIPVTAVDNTGGVGMRDNNPIEVSNLPQGLKYEKGQITGTTNAKTGYYTVKIKAYDKNNNASEKSIRITVQDQADKYNPTGDSLTVNQGQEITDEAVKAKVSNAGPGTLTVESKPTSTATAGNAGNAVVKVTYPDGSHDTVNVPVTVKDVTGPTITAESVTVTKNEPITPIPVTAVDNTGGVGMRDNNPIQVSNLPQGLKYENGQITGTTNAKTGFYTVKITAYDKNNTPSTKTIRITVQDQLAGTATGKTVPEKTPVPANTNVVTPNRPGTTITTDKPVNGLTVDNGGNLVGTPTVDNWEPKEEERTVEIPVKLKNGPEEAVVKVPVKIQRDTDGDGIPDVTDPDDDNDGIPDTEDANPKVADKLTGKVTGKTVPEKTPVPANTKVITPNKPGTTITTDKPVNGLTVDNGGNLVGTPTVDNWEPKEEERTVEIPVKLKKGTEEVVVKVPVKIQRDTDGDGIPDVKDPDDDNDGIPDTEDANPKVADKLTGKVTGKTVPEKTPVPANTKVITPNKPGTTITTDKPVNGLTVDNGGNLVGTPTVDNWEPKEEERTVEIPVKLKKGTEEVVVKVPVKIQRDTDGDGIPDVKDPDDDNDGIPDEEEITNGTDPKTPTTQTPTIEITQQPNGDAIVTPKKPDGSTYPPGTKVEIPGKDKDHPITVTIGEDGKGNVPNSELPEGKVPGTGKITEPGKPTEEVPVETPSKITPDAPTTEQPVAIEINQKPNGDAVVTPKKQDGNPYPSGTKVEIPGEDKDGNPITITVTIGDNGSGEVPNDNLPKKDIPGKGKVTEPNKNPSKPVDVTTPAHKTPTLDVEQDPKTGDVTVTPKKPDGSQFPPGTKVEIPGKDKDHPITVTIGEDGKGKVPNSELPEGKVPGTGKITEPGKPTVEVPNVTTPAKVTPETPTTETPSEIEITRKPNGDAIVTPKKPDGKPYPPKTTVEIPGENGTPIKVTIGDNGSGEVPNDKLPKKDVPGTGTVTEPNKKPSQPVDVTTPARKTPTIELKPDPKTGDVTVTPQRPGGGTYPPGTKVEIPGENGTPIPVEIGEDGKGKVPNDKLPKKDVPGTGKITEPGKPTVEVPNVTTPARKTPTIELKPDPKTGDVTVTPQRPGGGTYPPGTKVEIPGEDGTPIPVEIGEDGKGKVPNDKLPKKDVPGTGKITEPGKPTVEVPNVTTPAKVTPETPTTETPSEIEITRKPNGDAIVTPKKPDGKPYPPKTTVEIPGENGTPIKVTIGDNGSGEVPNDKLPKKDVPGTGTVTEPNKKPSQPVDVTTPARKTPTIELKPDPKTGDVTVTPQRPGGGTYPPGTKVEIPGENGTPIPVEIGEDGKGKVPNDKLPKKDVPGTGKITEPGKPTVEVPNVTTPARKTPTIELKPDPKTGDVTVTPQRPGGGTYPPGTKVEIPGEDGTPIPVEIGEDGKGKVPNDKLPKKDVPGTGKITEPGKPTVEVPNVTTPAKVTPETPTTETPSEIEITRKPNGDAIVTPKKPDGKPYPPKTTVEIPGENGTPIKVTIGDNGSGEVPNDKLPKKDVPGTGTVTEPNKKPSQPVDVTTPARKTPTIELKPDPKTGDVTVTPQRPGGGTYPPGTKVEIPGKDGNPITVTIGEDGKGKVPNSELPDGKVPGTGKITEPGQPAVEVPVETPAKVTPETPVTEKPGKIEITQQPNGNAIVTPKKPDGSTYPPKTTVEIPGENGTPITVTIGDNGSGEVPNDNLPKTDVPGKGKVTEPNKKPSQPVDVTTPARKTPTVDVEQDPKTGDVTVTPKKPDGKPYPPGTKVEIPGKDGNPITVTIGEDGKGKVPNSELPDGKVPGTGKITEPGKPAVEVPVTTPGKVTPNTPTTETPSEIEITRKPNGDAIVTPKKPNGKPYPPGTTVEIPGENGTPITVTIGDNGSGEVPNDNLPKKDVPGTGTVTEPNKKPSQPVDVTTPARKTPTLDVEQDPKTGDVTVTPKKPDGSTFPPGTKVEIPGKDGNPITVTIGEDGKGKVPNSELPDGKVPGTGKITEPGQPAVEVPVETPAKVTPETPVTEKPGKIEITQQPNGNAIVTPKKPDGSTYPPKTTVEIPGENGTPITVTIGDNGSGEVPNDNLPKKDVPGTGTVTEPNKKPSQPVDVTTPARKTPTLDVEQDPKTGDVTVTPKKPDGSTYPPGTKVEIPGKDGNPITVTIGEDGKGKVPNSELPDGKVPGTGKITEPGQPAVEVPVETPAKVTPETPVAPVTPDTNGAKSNDSQKVLPNTGTESNATLASLGLLGILGGLGLALGKKKKTKNLVK